MIFVECGTAGDGGVEDAAVLAASLSDADLPAAVLRSSLPDDLPFTAAYDFVRYVASGPATADDRLLILHAHAVDDERLSALRRLSVSGLSACVAAGHFQDRQAEFATRARLGYALGHEPDLLPLPDEGRTTLAHPGAPVFGVDRGQIPQRHGRLRVLLIDPPAVESGTGRMFQALSASRRLETTILTNGKTKSELVARGETLPIYHYGEAPPGALARRTDVAVFCGPVPKAYRLRMLLADLAVSGAGLLDASEGFQTRRLDPSFVPAPADPTALAAFLVSEILPDAGDLRELSRRSATASQSREAFAALSASLRAGDVAPHRPRRRAQTVTDGPARVVFMPTNGVGLGHAQRCSLIAGSLDRSQVEPVFAAFPSCARMLKSYGFDVMPLVAKSGLHAESLANDLVNYGRIDDLAASSSAFVFDGGFIFNSVFRTILDRAPASVWIRRGLWQGAQDNSLALEREKIFDRVIVPQEAFDELNETYSSGERVCPVGPIVQRTDLDEDARRSLRSALAGQFGLPFSTLVVTMLGGGVAADRSAQTIALAATLSRRPDLLHLVVVWPTATIDPGLFGWPNTRIVKTHHASALVAASDLYVSAAGYNSFHEALYNRVAAIFIPQMASYMDDQRARAAAAHDRGLAKLVEPHEIMSLDATVGQMLDGEAAAIRERLTAQDLPDPGCTAAADLISELAGARAGRRPVPIHRRVA
jgi:hypothetical protein